MEYRAWRARLARPTPGGVSAYCASLFSLKVRMSVGSQPNEFPSGHRPLGLLLLAILDSTGLPLPNGLDAYLIFLAVKDPPRAYMYAAISIAGSTIGMQLCFWLRAAEDGVF